MADLPTATRERDRKEIFRFIRLYAQQYQQAPLPALELLEVLARIEALDHAVTFNTDEGDGVDTYLRTEISKLRKQADELQNKIERLVRELSQKIDGLKREAEAL